MEAARARRRKRPARPPPSVRPPWEDLELEMSAAFRQDEDRSGGEKGEKGKRWRWCSTKCNVQAAAKHAYGVFTLCTIGKVELVSPALLCLSDSNGAIRSSYQLVRTKMNIISLFISNIQNESFFFRSENYAGNF